MTIVKQNDGGYKFVPSEEDKTRMTLGEFVAQAQEAPILVMKLSMHVKQ